MIKPIKIFLALLIQIPTLCNEFEKNNNKLLLEAVNTLQKNEDPDKLKKIEMQYKKNIESDVKTQLANLDKETIKSLGDFNASFQKLKEKLEIIKSCCSRILKNLVEEVNKKDLAWDVIKQDFLLTILGFKPTSIGQKSPGAPYNERWGNIKEIYNIVNQKFINELYIGEIDPWIIYSQEDVKEKDPKKVYHEIIVCNNPIFPINFVTKLYPKISITNSLIDKFLDLQKSNDKIGLKNFMNEVWNKKNKSTSTSDDLALLLGYAPTWFGNVFFNETYKCIMDPNYSQYFRVLLIPGTLSCTDRSTYVKLYEKLLEYVFIDLCGLEYYIKNLATNINDKLNPDASEPDKNLSNLKKIILQANAKS